MQSPLWVFGYGSLLWNPGFPVAETRAAVLRDFHRSFCMRSIHHRGTEEAPGLVLALDADAGATCTGIAFRVEPGAEGPALASLRERELISSAYLETTQTVEFDGGGSCTAVTYIIDPHHVQYCGGLPLEEQAQVLAQAVGGRGPNWEYLFNTVTHLRDMGVEDPDLNWLAGRVADLRA